MHESEPRGVQPHPPAPISGMKRITQDRMADGSELDADLVPPPGAEPELERGGAGAAGQHAVVRDGLLALPDLPHPEGAVLAERGGERAGIGLDVPRSSRCTMKGRRAGFCAATYSQSSRYAVRSRSFLPVAIVSSPGGLSITSSESSSWTRRRGGGKAGRGRPPRAIALDAPTGSRPSRSIAPLTVTRPVSSHCLRLRREAWGKSWPSRSRRVTRF